jgi:hypothetical protein
MISSINVLSGENALTAYGEVLSSRVSSASRALDAPLFERFRYDIGRLEFVAKKERAGDGGYFRLGERAVCFGHSSSGQLAAQPNEMLPDLRPEIVASNATVSLPFDPNEVITNLREERYAIHATGWADRIVKGPMIRNAYYAVRPLLSVNTRKHLQRLALRNWNTRPFPRWPVDLSVESILEELLLAAMQASGVYTVPFVWFWPDGHSSCALVTHDVETEAGRAFCSELMNIDDSYRIPASFQVIPTKRYRVTEEYLDSIRSRGFEVAVQDWNHDGHLFSERNEFLRRADKINEFASRYQIKGFRAAMLYRNVDWFADLVSSYDMSVPNVAHLDPQRGGCCTVFPYFIGNTLELPVTTTQDYTLFHVLNDYSIDLWKTQCSRILEVNGLMNIIVHPDYLVDALSLTTYRSLLEYLASLREQKGTWIPLPGEVDTWWRDRSQMSLVCENGTYRVVGPGSERARLAWASVQDGRVVYTLQ